MYFKDIRALFKERQKKNTRLIGKQIHFFLDLKLYITEKKTF